MTMCGSQAKSTETTGASDVSLAQTNKTSAPTKCRTRNLDADGALAARGSIHRAAGIAGCDPQNRDASRDFASRGSLAALAARGKNATIAFFPGRLAMQRRR